MIYAHRTYVIVGECVLLSPEEQEVGGKCRCTYIFLLNSQSYLSSGITFYFSLFDKVKEREKEMAESLI